ncbi:sugar ABC transporter substrate-binding protein [Ruania suaedae]|uniref:ABC transporter substrate-binding protein n=1 Tax=Ruania suaedae TaxID=2897774 RepID=UPI001E33F7AD|nr:sugar ABC transporter substrate-binding protein [Ruania suaedae]UFU01908.1 sugar ABC transporter substrate-binding protein [Ruania suaedae]
MNSAVRPLRTPRRRGSQAAVAALAVAALATACGGGDAADGGDADSDDEVTIEFMQWWEPELPDGALAGLIDEFESENPGINVDLLSGPYASIKDQVIAGSASGTMPDVLGLAGSWVHDFATQGSIANLTDTMAEYGYDDSQLGAQVRVDGSAYSIPVVNFAYPMFVNNTLLEEAGVEVPTTRSEFADAAQQITDSTEASGFVAALGLEQPNGIQIDIMPWNWASGGTMLTEDGGPAADNEDVRDTVAFIKELWDAGVMAPGGLTMAEQDKVEEFTNGRVAMMVSSLAHINLIRESSPDLDFSVVPMPVTEGYTGESGVRYAEWGIGMSAGTEHPEESWKLIEFIMSEQANGELSSFANGFPGNVNVTPDLEDADPLFRDAFEIWQAGYPASEFTGLPLADELMRVFDQELQEVLAADKPIDEAMAAVQEEWSGTF